MLEESTPPNNVRFLARIAESRRPYSSQMRTAQTALSFTLRGMPVWEHRTLGPFKPMLVWGRMWGRAEGGLAFSAKLMCLVDNVRRPPAKPSLRRATGDQPRWQRSLCASCGRLAAHGGLPEADARQLTRNARFRPIEDFCGRCDEAARRPLPLEPSGAPMRLKVISDREKGAQRREQQAREVEASQKALRASISETERLVGESEKMLKCHRDSARKMIASQVRGSSS